MGPFLRSAIWRAVSASSLSLERLIDQDPQILPPTHVQSQRACFRDLASRQRHFSRSTRNKRLKPRTAFRRQRRATALQRPSGVKELHTTGLTTTAFFIIPSFVYPLPSVLSAFWPVVPHVGYLRRMGWQMNMVLAKVQSCPPRLAARPPSPPQPARELSVQRVVILLVDAVALSFSTMRFRAVGTG